MGIRFHCPNGHKLNVKSFLAGKKGVCPDCGVKLRIPDRSEPGLDSGIDEGKQIATLPQQVPAAAPAPAVNTAAVVAAPLAAPVRPAAAPMPVPLPVAAPQPAMTQSAYVPPQPVRAAVAYGAQPAAIPPFTPPAGPIMPPPPPAMAGAIPAGVAADPIAENPLATWFVRPPSGGQFGPARGEVMRKWLTEGRVTSDSLVWREGWVDWLAATEVFPSLGKPATANLFSMQPAGPKTSAVIPAAGKKQSSGLSVAILALLGVICLALIGVLAVLLSGGFGST